MFAPFYPSWLETKFSTWLEIPWWQDLCLPQQTESSQRTGFSVSPLPPPPASAWERLYIMGFGVTGPGFELQHSHLRAV